MEDIRHSNSWASSLQLPDTFASRYFSNIKLNNETIKIVSINKTKRKVDREAQNSLETDAMNNQERKVDREAQNSLETNAMNNQERKVDREAQNSLETDAMNNQERNVSDKSPKKKGKLHDVLNAEAILTSSLNVKNRKSNYGFKRLKDCFYDVSCSELAKGILGKILVRRLEDGTILKGRIVETECYLGGEDKASHSYNGRITERSKPMYMKPGTTYVYLTYGMYHCFNISSQGPGAAVLLRALEPLEGLEYMKQEREKQKKSVSTKAKNLKPQELCNGPAKLCISLNITKNICNEQDLTVWDGMWIEDDETTQSSINPCHIVTSHRIGIDSVGIEWASKPLRFYILGNTSVSKRDKAKEREVLEMSKHFSYTSY